MQDRCRPGRRVEVFRRACAYPMTGPSEVPSVTHPPGGLPRAPSSSPTLVGSKSAVDASPSRSFGWWRQLGLGPRSSDRHVHRDWRCSRALVRASRRAQDCSSQSVLAGVRQVDRQFEGAGQSEAWDRAPHSAIAPATQEPDPVRRDRSTPARSRVRAGGPCLPHRITVEAGRRIRHDRHRNQPCD
jgi:hypothetical protein